MLERRCAVTCFCNPKKKERTLDFNRYKTPPGAYATVLKSRFKKWKAGILSQKMLFPPCVVVDFFFDEEERRYAITRRQRKEHKKGEKLARASQNSPYSNPLCPFFPSSFHSFNLPHAGGEIQKRSICISKTERKQTMKKRAPTLPPTIIDRGLSMIAMRVTFSRACARARKKKVILYARANARKNAREKVKRKWKKNAFFRYRYKIHENSLSQTFIKTAVCLIFDFKEEEEKTERESRERKERN